MRFRATIELGGRAATGLEVPDEVVADLGSSKRPAIRASASASASASAGDEVDVDVELDSEPREVTVPPDFADWLDREAVLRRAVL